MRAVGSWLRHRFRRSLFHIFQLEVTTRCNLQCGMCPRVSLSTQWSHGDMSLRTFNRIATRFPDVQVVYLSGWGEPLLHPRILDMARSAKDAACTVGFTTNGIRLTERVSREIVQLQLDMIAVSIDGATAHTYETIRRGATFSQLVDNVRGLIQVKQDARSHKPEIVLTFLMTQENVRELPLVVDLAHNLAMDRVVATNLDCVLKPQDEALHVFSCNGPEHAFQEAVAKAHARAKDQGTPLSVYPLEMRPHAICTEDPLRNVCFSWDGKVSPCVCLNIPNAHGVIPRIFCGRQYEVPCTSFGDVNEEDVQQIWQKQEYRAFRQHFSNRQRVNDDALTERMLQDKFGDRHDPDDKRSHIQQTMRALPLPPVCATCYKAYGV